MPVLRLSALPLLLALLIARIEARPLTPGGDVSLTPANLSPVSLSPVTA